MNGSSSVPYILICGLMISTACERPAKVLATRWHGDTPMPAVPLISGEESKVQGGSEEIRWKTQQIEGVPVQGAYLKVVAKDGKDHFLSYRLLDGNDGSLKKRIRRHREGAKNVLEKIENKYPGFREMKWQAGPELQIQMLPKARLVWRTVFESKNAEMLALIIDEDLKLVDVVTLGSGFSEATAALFPKGPLKSEVSDVRLKNLLNPVRLESNQVLVKTESDLGAIGDKGQFRFSSEDVRFSQVQAYYFAAESLQWFFKTFQFSLPFQLEVETQKGYPSKLNTAFYFQHKIRLGEGDDVQYSRIPLDPSIVIHESAHAVVEAVARLPYEGEGGSLNEAYADFFAAIQLENPKMGEASYRKEPFKRNIENDLKLNQKNGGLYHDSLIVSSLLWNIRNELGTATSLRLAWRTLFRLGPDSNFQIWNEELNRVLLEEPADIQSRVRGICKARGWNENETTTQKESL